MSDWEIHVHLDDEQEAHNMMEELNGDGLGVTLYKREVCEKADMILQYHLLSPKKRDNGVEA